MFKYFPPERIDILQNNLICFNNPRHFNDPFEFYSLYDLDGFMIDLEDKIKNTNAIKHFSPEQNLFYQNLNIKHKELMLQAIKESMKHQFQHNIGNIIALARGALEKLNEEFIKITRVLCLTEKPNNILMWAHYASSHTGFVVEFDQENGFFKQSRSLKDEYGYLRKVKYHHHIPQIDPLSENISEHYLIKSDEWKYEQEWRMFAIEKDSSVKKTINNNVYDLYTLPPSTIKRIILGCQATEGFKDLMSNTLRKDIKYSHVILNKARRSNSKFEIEIDTL